MRDHRSHSAPILSSAMNEIEDVGDMLTGARMSHVIEGTSEKWTARRATLRKSRVIDCGALRALFHQQGDPGDVKEIVSGPTEGVGTEGEVLPLLRAINRDDGAAARAAAWDNDDYSILKDPLAAYKTKGSTRHSFQTPAHLADPPSPASHFEDNRMLLTEETLKRLEQFHIKNAQKAAGKADQQKTSTQQYNLEDQDPFKDPSKNPFEDPSKGNSEASTIKTSDVTLASMAAHHSHSQELQSPSSVYSQSTGWEDERKVYKYTSTVTPARPLPPAGLYRIDTSATGFKEDNKTYIPPAAPAMPRQPAGLHHADTIRDGLEDNQDAAAARRQTHLGIMEAEMNAALAQMAADVDMKKARDFVLRSLADLYKKDPDEKFLNSLGYKSLRAYVDQLDREQLKKMYARFRNANGQAEEERLAKMTVEERLLEELLPRLETEQEFWEDMKAYWDSLE